MRHRISCCVAVLALLLLPAVAGPTNDQVLARKTALDLAGAFSNDGFKLRDGHWDGQIAPGKSHVVQVNLYTGNEYWFCLGATEAAKKLAVTVFDEGGKPVEFEPYTDSHTAAAGFSPTVSGAYYIKIEELEGGPASFCLLYSYK